MPAVLAWIGTTPARGADPVPYLRVETGVHGSVVNHAVALPGGAAIATVSDDKTARIWSADTLMPLGVVRPPLGPGDDGALYAVAAAGNVLAVGGRIRDGERQFKVGFFRLPDLRPIGQLGQLAAPVSALKFSRDGRTLVVGMIGGAGVGFFDMRSGAADQTDAAYAGEVQWIDVDAAGRTVVSGEDGRLRLYGPDHRRIGDPVALADHTKPFAVAFSPDGKLVAVGDQSSARVVLLDAALHPVRSLGGAPGRSGAFGVVAFAPGGQSVVGAGTYKLGSGGIRLARRWTLDGRSASEMQVGSDTVTSLVPLGDAVIATDGLPLIARLDASGRVLASQRSHSIDFRDASLTGFGVSADGAAIQIPGGGPRQDADGQIRGAPQVFDTRERAILAPAAAPALSRPSERAGSLVASGWRNGVDPRLGNRPVRLERDEHSLAVAASPAAGGVVFGTNFFVRFERPDGREWHVVAPAPAYAVNVSGDGRWVVAGLGDGTVRWYDAADGHEALNLFVAPAEQQGGPQHWVLSTPNAFFDHDTASGAGGSRADGRELIGYSLNDAQNQAARFVEIGQLYPQFYRPDLVGLALRHDAPAQQAVQGAEQRQAPVGEVLNQGLPPKLDLLEACGWTAAPSLERTAGPGCPSLRTDTAAPADHPGARLATTADTLLVRYRLTDTAARRAASAVGQAQITRSAAVIAAKPVVVSQEAHSRTEEVAIPLALGANLVRLRPLSAAGEVQGADDASAAFTAWRMPAPSAAPAHQTTLYLLSVGVSSYAHKELMLDNASSDARAVSRLMQTPDPPLYDVVRPVELLDREATEANVIKALQSIAENAGPDDLVMIFFAGHGAEVDGHYYFATSDIGTADPALFARAIAEGGGAVDRLFRTEGVGPERLLPIIQSIKAAHLAIVLDTCYSGSLATQDIVMQRNVNTTVTNALGNAVGRFVLSSATTLALDSSTSTLAAGQDGHGLFTSFLLAALQGKADLLHSGRVDVVQLAQYTIANVVRETGGMTQKQQPTFYFSGSDFFALRTD